MNTLAEKYINIRFLDSTEEYKDEWRNRFEDGREWVCSDFEGRRLLQELAPKDYPTDLF